MKMISNEEKLRRLYLSALTQATMTQRLLPNSKELVCAVGAEPVFTVTQNLKVP